MKDANKARTRPFPKKNPEVVYRLANDRLQAQLEQIDSLDGKIGNLLGFGGALVGILAGFLALSKNTIPCSALAWLGLSGAAYLIMAAFSLFAYYARPWQAGPNLSKAWQHSRRYKEKQTAWWAAESLTRSYENNRDSVKRKAYTVRINVALIALQSITLGVGLGFVAFN